MEKKQLRGPGQAEVVVSTVVTNQFLYLELA